MGKEVLSLSRYSHSGGALPFLGYSGLDISFASSISQAMYGCRPVVMVATPLFMASRNHTALSCLLLTTYYLILAKGRRGLPSGSSLSGSFFDGSTDAPCSSTVSTPCSVKDSTVHGCTVHECTVHDCIVHGEPG